MRVSLIGSFTSTYFFASSILGSSKVIVTFLYPWPFFLKLHQLSGEILYLSDSERAFNCISHVGSYAALPFIPYTLYIGLKSPIEA